MEITKDYTTSLSKVQKKQLEQELLALGIAHDYVMYLIYGQNFIDVKGIKKNGTETQSKMD